MRRHEKLERAYIFQKTRGNKDKVRAPIRGFFFRSGYRRVKYVACLPRLVYAGTDTEQGRPDGGQ